MCINLIDIRKFVTLDIEVISFSTQTIPMKNKKNLLQFTGHGPKLADPNSIVLFPLVAIMHEQFVNI
jgi:hypothetical protein